MKNFSVCVILICIICSCQNLADHDENAAEVIKEDVVQDSSGDAFGLHEYPADAGLNHRTMSSCGGYYSGDYFTLNKYYAYPLQKLDIDCAALNSTINVTFKAAEIPNKFDIVKGSTVVAQSTSSAGGWLGYATYPGNWGTSMSVNATQSKTFIKSTNESYYIRVYTQTPPNYSYDPGEDHWDVTVSCTCSSTPPPPPPPPPPTCACDNSFSGQYGTINRHHIYPTLYEIDLSCVPNGEIVSFYFGAFEVVNLFVVKKANGSVVLNTGWIGYATYPGNWGTSVNGPSTKNLSFVKTENKYYLQVSTQTPPNSYDYYPTMDRWEVRVGC